jgi:F-type H+-transporting ATPase subunit c
MLSEFKMVGSGLGAIALGGVGTGIGMIFQGLPLSVAQNPALSKGLFNYAILGFAMTEAIALFTVMIVFLILFQKNNEYLFYNKFLIYL